MAERKGRKHPLSSESPSTVTSSSFPPLPSSSSSLSYHIRRRSFRHTILTPLLTSLMTSNSAYIQQLALALNALDPSPSLPRAPPLPTDLASSSLLAFIKKPSYYTATSFPDPSVMGLSWAEGRPWWTWKELELDFNPGVLAAFVLDQEHQETYSLDLSSVPDQLGEQGFRSLLRDLSPEAPRWVRRPVIVSEGENFCPYVLPLLLSFIDSLPLLQELVVQTDLSRLDLPYFRSFLLHPSLEHFNLRSSLSSPYNRQSLHELPEILSENTHLRRLSLGRRTALDTEMNRPMWSAVRACVEKILERGRETGLEYLDLREFPISHPEAEPLQLSIGRLLVDGEPMVVQRVWWLGVGGGGDPLVEQQMLSNQARRSFIHRTASNLLVSYRALLLPTSSSPPGTRTSFASLPRELRRTIALLLDPGPFYHRQVMDLLRFAEDRTTLKGAEDRGGKQRFLQKVDCWRAMTRQDGELGV